MSSNSTSEMRDEMSYELGWHVPGKVLSLSLSGTYTPENAKEVNQLITDKLDQSKSPILLLIDAMKMDRPFHFDSIRALQTYMDHRNLKHIYIVTNDKIVKLSMLVIFNLSRARLHMFDNVEKANRMLMQH